MEYKEFVQQAVLAQMQGHPILGTTYLSSTCNQLISNAVLLAEILENGGFLNKKGCLDA